MGSWTQEEADERWFRGIDEPDQEPEAEASDTVTPAAQQETD